MSGRSLGMEGNTNTQTETTNMEQVGNLTFGSAGTGDDGTKNAIGCLQWFLTQTLADLRLLRSSESLPPPLFILVGH